jgi:hypothetical protein
LVIGMGADRLEDRCTGHVVHPDGAECSQLSAGRHRDNVEVTLV